MWGKRRLLLGWLAALVAGSVIAALSSSLAPLLIGRALQGLATGVVPLGISLMRDHLPPPRLASATAVMSASLGVGASSGLPLSALLVQYANWRLLFWVSGGLAALAAWLARVVVTESRQRTGGRFDALGQCCSRRA
jgi:predicted MFS family arabinose efflux permease